MNNDLHLFLYNEGEGLRDDADGYRTNVGIIIEWNDRWPASCGWDVFGQNAWQFPQAGIKSDQTPEEAYSRT